MRQLNAVGSDRTDVDNAVCDAAATCIGDVDDVTDLDLVGGCLLAQSQRACVDRGRHGSGSEDERGDPEEHCCQGEENAHQTYERPCTESDFTENAGSAVRRSHTVVGDHVYTDVAVSV
jgi:hypothetical protein